jgi:uncharacterized membrane protein YhaH (DUF805 family)
LNWRDWIDGRAGRREYWLYLVLLFGLGYVLSFLPGRVANLAIFVILTLVQVRRMHDMGRTGWWALGAALAPVALAVALFAVTSPEDATMISTLFVLLLTVIIGLLPGDPGGNRFGPPAPFTWLRFFQGR